MAALSMAPCARPAILPPPGLRRIDRMTTLSPGAARLAAERRDPMPDRRAASLHRGVSRHGAAMQFSGPIEGLTDPALHGVPLQRAQFLAWNAVLFEASRLASADLRRYSGPRPQDQRIFQSPQHRPDGREAAQRRVESLKEELRQDFHARLCDGRLRAFGWPATRDQWEWISDQAWPDLRLRGGEVTDGHRSYRRVHVHDPIGVPDQLAFEIYGPRELAAELKRFRDHGVGTEPDREPWKPFHSEAVAARSKAEADVPAVLARLATWLAEQLAAGSLFRLPSTLIVQGLPGAAQATSTSAEVGAVGAALKKIIRPKNRPQDIEDRKLIASLIQRVGEDFGQSDIRQVLLEQPRRRNYSPDTDIHRIWQKRKPVKGSSV